MHRICLFKRSNGVYYVAFHVDGKRLWRSTGATTKAEALQQVARLQELVKPKPPITRLAEFVPKFLEFARTQFRPATVVIYERAFKVLRAATGDIPLIRLTAQHLDGFKVQRLSTCGAVAVNMDVRALRAAMSTAVRWKLLDVNPFREVKPVRVAETSPVFLSQADFKALLDMCDGWLREILVVFVCTGLRRGELLNLKWDSIDFARRIINIESSATFRTKQGRRRIVPMNDVVLSILQSKRRVSDCVFTYEGRRIKGDHLQHRFKTAVRAAKLNPALHLHSLRHTAASWWIQNGASLYEVQRLLGHSSPVVTQVYSHMLPEQLHSVVNRVVMN